jgi:hypothetical protein
LFAFWKAFQVVGIRGVISLGVPGAAAADGTVTETAITCALQLPLLMLLLLLLLLLAAVRYLIL